MYDEVYKWSTETSDQGPMEQSAMMMNPKPASKEEDIAEAIEMCEENVNRLARHGEDYKLSEALKEVALNTDWWVTLMTTLSYGGLVTCRLKRSLGE